MTRPTRKETKRISAGSMGIFPRNVLGPRGPASVDIVPDVEGDAAAVEEVVDDAEDDADADAGAVGSDDEADAAAEEERVDEGEDEGEGEEVEKVEISELPRHEAGMLSDPGGTIDDWLAKIAETKHESATAVTGA
ncbi:hypothetical protein FA10DRAFT_267805 [Acaromyces ingoldii]|uniref:Uncharacterized protein n=1 Tax=Acaromyces ingoldii TaxID=215250 RepID=A0A316YJ42_9BASI|nr:hypothetical protein FA10DRAFT_267805 [Acaromyces ingoldii]PWN89229.1 hypothetical protein FA10DRAFT_267805 [Acaromyces ingoldii]